jgi:hypothetical protein
MPGERNLTERLREAVASGEFPKAQALWGEFAQRLQGEIERGEVSRQDMAAVGELVQWVTRVALAAQAQAGDQLRECRGAAQVSRAYGEREKRGPSLVRKQL